MFFTLITGAVPSPRPLREPRPDTNGRSYSAPHPGPEHIWPADLPTLPQREPPQSAPFMQETENNPFGLLQRGYSDGEGPFSKEKN